MQKLLKVVAAAALAGASLSSFAAMNIGATAEDNTELVMTGWSRSASLSYTFDTGLKLADFIATGNTAGLTITHSLAADMATAQGQSLFNAADFRWAVTGYDMTGDLTPGTLRLLVTADVTAPTALYTPVGGTLGDPQTVTAPDGMIGQGLQNGAASWFTFVSYNNVLVSHSTVANGSAFATPAQSNQYLLATGNPVGDLNNNLGFQSGNAKDATSNFYYFTAIDPDFGDSQAAASAFTGTWKIDGSNLVYSVPAAPIPEPGSYAMLLAGVAALGLFARRRAR